MRWLVLALVLVACGDDNSPTSLDASSARDGGSSLRDTGAVPDTGGGGGSTVGQICANDSNCTGAGERCCLASSPYVCQLATNCDDGVGGLPCTASADCPNSRICCRLGTDRMCMTSRSCTDLGGEVLP